MLELVGKKFGKLKVLKFWKTKRKGRIGNRASWWTCLCDCGNKKQVQGGRLVSGHTKSCGCLSKEWGSKPKKHGLARRGRLSTQYTLWYSAKRRSKKFNIPFKLDIEDVQIPDFCPLLNIPLKKSADERGPHSPSLDRIDPTLGYTINNTWVISWRANRAKSDLTPAELKLLLENFESAMIERKIHETR